LFQPDEPKAQSISTPIIDPKILLITQKTIPQEKDLPIARVDHWPLLGENLKVASELDIPRWI
jgi:hypothetical protein